MAAPVTLAPSPPHPDVGPAVAGSIIAAHLNRSPAPPRSRADLLVAALILASTASLYALTFAIVRRYYATHLPHYDSIGSYGFMFGVVNLARTDGVAAAAVMASEWSTTWLHGFFALLVAWLPGARSPEVLALLNVGLLLVAQASIVTCVRGYGFGPLKQIVAGLMPLVPGALYVWDGGIQDMRRDPQLVLLSIACLFLSLTYVRDATWRKGLAIGVVVGLAQWSRDNAAATIAIVAVPAIVLALLRYGRRGDWLGLARIATLPLGVFLLFAVPYYGLTLQQTLRRYSEVVWGIGEDRVASLRAFADAPLSVLLGGDARYGGRPGVQRITLGLLGSGALGIGLLVVLRVARIAPRRMREGAGLTLVLAGVYVMVAVVLYNTIGLGYGAGWHAMPFLPTVVGVVTVLVGLLAAIEPGHLFQLRQRAAHAVAAAGAVVLVGASAARMVAAEPSSVGAGDVSDVRYASLQIAAITKDRTVAFLWRAGFGRHHARYYLTQAGLRHLSEYEGRSTVHGTPIDFEQPLRATDDPVALRRTLDYSLRRFADYVLVAEDLARYEDPNELFWPYRVGRPVIERLMADPNFVPRARFRLLGVPFVLLENMKVLNEPEPFS